MSSRGRIVALVLSGMALGGGGAAAQEPEAPASAKAPLRRPRPRRSRFGGAREEPGPAGARRSARREPHPPGPGERARRPDALGALYERRLEPEPRRARHDDARLHGQPDAAVARASVPCARRSRRATASRRPNAWSVSAGRSRPGCAGPSGASSSPRSQLRSAARAGGGREGGRGLSRARATRWARAPNRTCFVPSSRSRASSSSARSRRPRSKRARPSSRASSAATWGGRPCRAPVLRCAPSRATSPRCRRRRRRASPSCAPAPPASSASSSRRTWRSASSSPTSASRPGT